MGVGCPLTDVCTFIIVVSEFMESYKKGDDNTTNNRPPMAATIHLSIDVYGLIHPLLLRFINNRMIITNTKPCANRPITVGVPAGDNIVTPAASDNLLVNEYV